MQNFSRAKLRAATPQPLLAGAFGTLIVVAAMGFAAFPSFVPMGWALSMIGGIVLIFDSVAIADLVIGSAGS